MYAYLCHNGYVFTLACVKVSAEMQKNRFFKADELMCFSNLMCFFTGNFTAILICILEHYNCVQASARNRY